jgi:triacylglycerol lipase
MLARLQRLTTLLLLAAVLGAVAHFAAAGQTVKALITPLVVVFGYALALASEFMLVAALHGDDPAPRASAAQRIRAWSGELITAPQVFCWRQPFRSNREPDSIPDGARGRRGAVFVHGFVCNRGLWTPWLARLRAQGVPFVAVNLEPVFGSIDAYASIVEQAVRRIEHATGLPPVLVAHSMGGLAVRAWLALAGGAARVHRVVTIATPHHGTWLARIARTANGAQMRQHGAWLEHLAQREAGARYAQFTCFYSHCDNICFPASTATLPGADNRHLNAVAHVRMALHPEVWSELRRWLAEPGGARIVTR